MIAQNSIDFRSFSLTAGSTTPRGSRRWATSGPTLGEGLALPFTPRYRPPVVGHAFCASRLDGDRGSHSTPCHRTSTRSRSSNVRMSRSHDAVPWSTPAPGPRQAVSAWPPTTPGRHPSWNWAIASALPTGDTSRYRVFNEALLPGVGGRMVHRIAKITYRARCFADQA
jgi:hypothetical protein